LTTVLRRLRGLPYAATVAMLQPVNGILSRFKANDFVPGSVLHISYLGHVPFHAVRVLREQGVRADYLAVGDSPIWQRSDYRMTSSRWPFVTAFREFRMLWRVVARYEIVHAHFMVTLSRTGWELPILRRMGRKLVVHYRGCEIRDREVNMRLHPRHNICEECDYLPRICEAPHNQHRRALARRFAGATLVTTPDMKDFVPTARHVRFFTPTDLPKAAPRAAAETRAVKIVHATNHPGIEGTRHIVAAVDAVRAKGYAIDLVVLSGVTQERVLAEMATADLTIGKMKMGYYANAQVESLALGVPAITSVRPEFMTPELADSGLIFATLDTLAATLERYLNNPAALAEKRARARASVHVLHDNAAIARELVAVYDEVRRASPDPEGRG
jgi:glycosyltransferase involved in cell wall biosynthesis